MILSLEAGLMIISDGETLSISDDLVARFPDGVLPVAQWTSLSTDDRYLTHLLNLFFTWDNALSYIIHRPMFIQDLKSGIPPASSGLGFCSRFLIHSILAVAHVSYDPVFGVHYANRKALLVPRKTAPSS